MKLKLDIRTLFVHVLPDGTKVMISRGTDWSILEDTGEYFIWEKDLFHLRVPAGDPFSNGEDFIQGFFNLDSAIVFARVLVRSKLIKLQKQTENVLLNICKNVKKLDESTCWPFDKRNG